MKQRLFESTKLVGKGFCMGAADVVPGVSGGTMAYILGIYPQLLAAINSFDLTWLRRVARLDLKGSLTYPHFGLLIPLGLGILLALICFTRVIPLPRLITSHPELVYGLFFGLILGSIVVLLKQIPKWSLKGIVFLSIGIALGYIIVTRVPTSTPDDAWFIFLSGAVAITAMILPGISGSFILLILGKYAYIFDAIGHLKLFVILPFALGIVTGLAIFSRLLAWLLRRYRTTTLLVINGFLIASLWVIWPFQHRSYTEVRGKSRLIESTPYLPDSLDTVLFYSLGLMILGMTVVLTINLVAKPATLVSTAHG